MMPRSWLTLLFGVSVCFWAPGVLMAETEDAVANDVSAGDLSAEPAPPESAASAQAPAELTLSERTLAAVAARPPLAEVPGDEPWRGEAPPRDFRLYSSRPIGLRLSPNVGIHYRDKDLPYSRLTPDYLGEIESYPSRHAVTAEGAWVFARDARVSGKGQEFRDLDDGLAIGLDAQWLSSRNWLRLTGRHLGLDDQDVQLEVRREGAFRAILFYNQIPHNYAFGARSLYSGIGTGVLEIDDAIQQALQGSTSEIDAAERLTAFVDGADIVDLALRRDRLDLRFDWTAFHPVAVRIDHHEEERRGERPWSASFGRANFVEIPWPVSYDISRSKVAVEYADETLFLEGSFRRSSFENNISSVVFDNPWRAIDSSLRVPNASRSSFAGGAATGAIDLYPDSDSEEITLTGVKRGLPGKAIVQGVFSWGHTDQNDPLMAYTTNSSIVPGAVNNPPFDASDPASLPAQSANARLETRLLHLSYLARPTKALRFKATYRDYELDNETTRIELPGFVPEDAEWRQSFVGPISNRPIAYRRSSLGAELGYRFAPDSRVTLSLHRVETDREFREVEEMEEDKLRISFDHKPKAWLDLRVSFEHFDRQAKSEYDYTLGDDPDSTFLLPRFRKFDLANRERDRLQLIANFFLSEDLSFTTMAIYGTDDYPDTVFGVQEDDHQVYSFDVSYVPNPRLSLFASYSFERYELLQTNREWFPFGVGDPVRTEPDVDSPSNWTADSIDDLQTFVLGVEWQVIPDRLELGLVVTRSDSDGEILLASPLGDPDANPFVPADFLTVDDVVVTSIHPELELSFGERFSLAAAYLREEYEIDDFNTRDFTPVPVTPDGEFNGGLLMGTLPADYELDVFTLAFKTSL